MDIHFIKNLTPSSRVLCNFGSTTRVYRKYANKRIQLRVQVDGFRTGRTGTGEVKKRFWRNTALFCSRQIGLKGM